MRSVRWAVVLAVWSLVPGPWSLPLQAQTTDQGLYRHVVGVTPTNAGVTGEMRFYEPYGLGGHYEGFRAASSLSASLVWTLPAADASGTQCLSSNGSGVLGWSACAGGGGGSSSGASTLIQLSDGSGGFSSVTGFSYTSSGLHVPAENDGLNEGGQVVLDGTTASAYYYVLDHSGGNARLWTDVGGTKTFRVFNLGGVMNQELTGSLLFGADSAYDVGTASVRPDEVFADNVQTEDLFFRRQGQPSHDFVWTNNAANELALLDAAAGYVLRFVAGTNRTSTFWSIVPAYSTLDLGQPSGGFRNIYVGNSIEPNAAGGATVGTASKPINAALSTATFHQDPRGSANAAVNLGLSSVRWLTTYTRNLNMDGTLTMTGNVAGAWTPASDQVYDLGTTSVQWRDFYGSSAILGDNGSGVNGAVKFEHGSTFGSVQVRAGNASGGVDAEVTGHFVPAFDNSYQNGLTGRRWSKMWTYDLDQSGNATITIGAGTFRGKMQAASSGSLSCSGQDGWWGVTTDNYLVVCRDTGTPVRLRVALSPY